ncbi:type VII secretion protein EccE [Nocardia higoensis]|uniref:type VII secretion protein EccE n=1 Tax=Nocardia higoensis TaxID=228599 RepID=UPI00031657F7|nr:type VII secretion protein EccE [Nocardia higoensis]
MTSTAVSDNPGNTSTAPRLHSTQFWFFRLLPLGRTLPVLVLAAVSAFVATVFAKQWWIPALVATLVIVVALTPRKGTNIAAWVGRKFTFAWQRFSNGSPVVNHSPFDVPLPDGGSYGMRWDGTRLITMLRIEAQPRTVVRLSPSGLLGDDMLPLPEIARCLDQFDISLASIDIISTGSRSAGTGAVARAYESILGPLPAVANRTVWVVLRLDPLANAHAVDRRGGGPTGTLRAAGVATRRVANRLAARGLSATVLSATEMSQAVTQLTHRAPLDEFVETSDSVEHDGLHHTTYRITPEGLGPKGIAEVWSAPTVATTITVRLQRAPERRPGADGRIAVTATARFVTREKPITITSAGLRPLTGLQRRALLFGLPLATGVPVLPLERYLGEPDALDDLPMPIAGCGQLIGADDSGQGVALPLVGRHVHRVEIIGSLLVAKQVILRAIALGAGVVVHTTRHEQWRPMLAYIDVPQALTLATWPAGSQQAGSYRFATMVVFDGTTPTGHYSDATVVLLRPHGSEGGDFEPDVTLVEDEHTPNRVTVRTASGETGVHMVATPEELIYVGARRPDGAQRHAGEPEPASA